MTAERLYEIAERMRLISARPEFGDDVARTDEMTEEFIELGEVLATWINPDSPIRLVQVKV